MRRRLPAQIQPPHPEQERKDKRNKALMAVGGLAVTAALAGNTKVVKDWKRKRLAKKPFGSMPGDEVYSRRHDPKKFAAGMRAHQKDLATPVSKETKAEAAKFRGKYNKETKQYEGGATFSGKDSSGKQYKGADVYDYVRKQAPSDLDAKRALAMPKDRAETQKKTAKVQDEAFLKSQQNQQDVRDAQRKQSNKNYQKSERGQKQEEEHAAQQEQSLKRTDVQSERAQTEHDNAIIQQSNALIRKSKNRVRRRNAQTKVRNRTKNALRSWIRRQQTPPTEKEIKAKQKALTKKFGQEESQFVENKIKGEEEARKSANAPKASKIDPKKNPGGALIESLNNAEAAYNGAQTSANSRRLDQAEDALKEYLRKISKNPKHDFTKEEDAAYKKIFGYPNMKHTLSARQRQFFFDEGKKDGRRRVLTGGAIGAGAGALGVASILQDANLRREQYYTRSNEGAPFNEFTPRASVRRGMEEIEGMEDYVDNAGKASRKNSATKAREERKRAKELGGKGPDRKTVHREALAAEKAARKSAQAEYMKKPNRREVGKWSRGKHGLLSKHAPTGFRGPVLKKAALTAGLLTGGGMLAGAIYHAKKRKEENRTR